MEQGGYLPALRKLVKGPCVPFWWSDHDLSGQPRIRNNGTLAVFAGANGAIGVTALHVYAAYLDSIAQNPDTTCQLGSSTWRPRDCLIDTSELLDLATFLIPLPLIIPSGISVHHVKRWPPTDLSEGEIVLLGGFPGPLRVPSDQEAEFAFQQFATRVDASSPHNIKVYLDTPSIHYPGHDGETMNADYGGLSGGPVFRHVAEPIERIELAGFIYEYSEGLDLVFARHARHVQQDGTIIEDLF